MAATDVVVPAPRTRVGQWLRRRFPATDGYVPAPRTRLGRWWNGRVQASRVVEFIDEWWWERRQVPSVFGAMALAGLVLFIGWAVVPVPMYQTIWASRVIQFTNIFHNAYLWLRYRDRTLFDQPQTWKRLDDGSMKRIQDAVHDDTAAERNIAEAHTLIGRAIRRMRLLGYDWFRDRRRIPGLVVGLTLPAIAFGLRTLFEFPIEVTLLLTYSPVVLGNMPAFLNVGRAIRYWDKRYINSPQLVPRAAKLRTVTVPVVEVARTTPDTPTTLNPAKRETTPRRRAPQSEARRLVDRPQREGLN